MTQKNENTEAEDQGTPVCEKCGNIMMWEPFGASQLGEAGFAQDEPSVQPKDSKEGEWVCPHCQGEINFLGEDEDE